MIHYHHQKMLDGSSSSSFSKGGEGTVTTSTKDDDDDDNNALLLPPPSAAVEVRSSPPSSSRTAAAITLTDRNIPITGAALQIQQNYDNNNKKKKNGSGGHDNDDDTEQLAKARLALQRRRRSGQDSAGTAAAAGRGRRSQRRLQCPRPRNITVSNDSNSTTTPTAAAASIASTMTTTTTTTKLLPKKPTTINLKDNLLEEKAVAPLSSSSSSPQQQKLGCSQQRQRQETTTTTTVLQQNQSISIAGGSGGDNDDDGDNDVIVNPQLQSRVDNVLSLLRMYYSSYHCSQSHNHQNTPEEHHNHHHSHHHDGTPTTTEEEKENIIETEIREVMVRIDKAHNNRQQGEDGVAVVQSSDSSSNVLSNDDDGDDENDNNIDRRHHRSRGSNGGRRRSSVQSSIVVGDNELIREMNSIVENNDPSITSFQVPHGDVRVGHLSRSFLIERFVYTGLRSNLYLQKLSMTGLSLNNDFLTAFGSALSSNIALRHIDISDNHFLGDGIVDFLQLVGTSNDTCQKINLRRQRSPVCYERQQQSVLEAFQDNESMVELHVDFEAAGFPKASTTLEVQEQLNKILQRNQEVLRQSTSTMSSEICMYRKGWDLKLLQFLRNEAEMVECMCEEEDSDDLYQFNLGVDCDESDDESIDWEHMYKLSILFDANKTQHIIGSPTSRPEKRSSSTLETPIISFHFAQSFQDANLTASLTPDGSFLTEEFISKYLKADEELDRLVFDFCGQSYVFKRFTIGDPARPLIISKFVDAILNHPRSRQITGINLANSCIGSDFFVHLAERCLGDSSVLPKLNYLNAETNYLGESGIIAISRCIASPTTWRYLQTVKLENQKSLLSSRAESALARAVSLNKSIVSVSLRVRNLHEKQVIDQEVAGHIDLLRQARQHHMAKKGIPSPRTRSDIEQLFDKVAANDSSVKEVKIVADRQFMSLSHEEKIKSASALKNNSHVKSVTMNALGLDDEYALILSDSLRENFTLQKLHLDNNSFSGLGITSILRALAHHPQLKEIQIRHQSKVLASVEEKDIPDLLQANTSLLKVGVDLRNKHTQLLLDRKLTSNRYSLKSVKC